MSAEDSFETLELAVDDHYGTVELFEDAIDDAAMGREVLTQLIEITQEYEEFRESTATVNTALASYLMDHREHMDARALELKNDQDKLEEVIENYSPSGTSTGGGRDIDININVNDTRRGFLGKAAAGVAILGVGAFGYESLENSNDEIAIANENIGSNPGEYDLSIVNSQVIEEYVSSLMDEEGFESTFRDVAEDINGETVSMGYIDDENRVDFYSDSIVSSVEMNNSFYQEARDELDDILQN